MEYLFSVEDNDLGQLKWHKHSSGYATKWFGKKKKYAHRIVLERKIERSLERNEVTDHVNRNKLDNRRENLKEHREKGWAKRWRAQVYRNSRAIELGCGFKTPLEAHRAREEFLNNIELP